MEQEEENIAADILTMLTNSDIDDWSVKRNTRKLAIGAAAGVDVIKRTSKFPVNIELDAGIFGVDVGAEDAVAVSVGAVDAEAVSDTVGWIGDFALREAKSFGGDFRFGGFLLGGLSSGSSGFLGVF